MNQDKQYWKPIYIQVSKNKPSSRAHASSNGEHFKIKVNCFYANNAIKLCLICKYYTRLIYLIVKNNCLHTSLFGVGGTY